MLASVGHFQEKFIQGLHYRWRGVDGRGAEEAGEARGEITNAQCPMPNAP
ncbi:hypothetical protein [Nostoc sp.]